MGVGGLVDPGAGQGVVDVGQGDHLGGDGDVLPLQAVRIAPAVVPLVVPAADLIGVFHQRLILEGDPLHHVGPHLGVALHDGELLVGKQAWLVEYLAGNADLAHVVEGGGVADQVDSLTVQLIAVGLAHKAFQQNFCHGLNVHDVQAALLIAELHNVAENGNHQVVDLLLLVDLLVHHGGQPALLGVEHDGVNHTAADHHHVEGAADVVGYSHVIGPLDESVGALRRDHDNGHAVDPVVFIHGGQHAEAVQIGHYNVQQDQGNLLLPLLEDGHRLQSVLRLDDIVGLLQHGAEDGAVHL